MAIDASTELPAVDPQVWRACAGPAAKLPVVRSAVCYFPQGHAEQASSPPDFPAGGGRRPSFFLCRAAAIGFHADPDTDEVFARIFLDPRPPPPLPLSPEPPSSSVEEPDDGEAAAFAKVLTPSDANNGGGFSVPRFCADSIFPPLDMAAEPPVQNVTIRDIHGKVWTFRHIYRGTPRRHLLTTGWSKFVNAKKLVAGDSVVFIKNRHGLLYVGIRRASRSCAGGPHDYFRYAPQAAAPPAAAAPDCRSGRSEMNMGTGKGFSRNARGRIPAEAVLEAVRLAEMGRPFEVVHYPRASAADFVVGVEKVNAALRVPWTAGMRVRMSVETEGLSRTTVFRGTVSGTTVQDQAQWPLSPWRMLQVTWDEAEVSQHIQSVNPWQVELDSATPQMQTPNSDPKKPRLLQYPNLLMDAEERMFFPMTGMTNKMMANVAPSLFSYNMFPAGMQGARHNSISVTKLPSFAPSNTDNLHFDNQCSNGMHQKTAEVPKELNVASMPQSESSSPPSQGSIHFQHMELPATAVCNPNKENIRPPFQLFGRIIHIDESSDADADADADKGHQETTYRRVSAVEGCFP
ncbi:auxin response factor 18 [Elaeis guineensis]|uniref:Auxin response factor n=1 Tax=Elaeis guineensis var. tenera TaxID=51953 RepID=A0A6I9QS71_ELAGV|nr:auxin response factor 18 [Elaeis guineensis]